MSDQEFTQGNTPSSTDEQIAHSGVHGYEKIVGEPKETSLQEDHDQGHLTVPESPQTWTEIVARDTVSSSNEKPGWSKRKIAATALSTVVGISAAVSAGAIIKFSHDAGGVESSAGVGETGITDGVKLSDKEISQYNSGDVEAQNEIMDTTLIPAIQDAVNDPGKLAAFSTDPLVLTKLGGLAEDAHTRAGESEEGRVYINVAPTKITSDNNEIYDRPTTIAEGSDVILPVKIDSLSLGEIKVVYTLSDITVAFDGQNLALVSE